MDINKLKAGLLAAIEKHNGRNVGVGELRIDWMARDCFDAIVDLEKQLAESRRREQAYIHAIQRHYDEMSSMCFICYSCVNHDARRMPLDMKSPYACSGCGKGKPKWQFDIDRFSGVRDEKGAKR